MVRLTNSHNKIIQSTKTNKQKNVYCIDSIEPDFIYGKIGNNTEVHVSLPASKTSASLPSKSEMTTVDKWKLKIFDVFHNITSVPLGISNERSENSKDVSSNDIETWIKNNDRPVIPQTFRVYSLSASLSNIKFRSYNERPYDVFVYECNFPADLTTLNNLEGHLYKIRKVHEDRQYVNTTQTDFLRLTDDSGVPKQSMELVVRLFVIESLIERHELQKVDKYNLTNSAHKPIYMSTNLQRNLKLRIGSKVLLEPLTNLGPSIISIELFSSSDVVTRLKFEEKLCNLTGDEKILVNSRSRIYFEDGTDCMVLCEPDKCSHCLVDAVELKKIAINVKVVKSEETETSYDVEKNFEDVNLETVSLL